MSTTLRHVRIIDYRAGRRITDMRGASHTLCGAPSTADDVTAQDAQKALRVDHLDEYTKQWATELCSACIDKLMAPVRA